MRSDSDCDDLPTSASFSIDEATARKILHLSQLVAEHGLYMVAQFDYRTVYSESGDWSACCESPELESTTIRPVRTEADQLHVTDRDFWFSAYQRDTNVEVRSARQRIADLAQHFELQTEQGDGVRYYLGQLEERNGERSYQHTLCFLTDGVPTSYLDAKASTFYDEDGGELEGDTYFFDGHSVSVTPGQVIEVDRAFYLRFHKLGAAAQRLGKPG